MRKYGKICEDIPKTKKHENAETPCHIGHLRRNTRLIWRYKTMIKILFICHGNICRSPMAEFIMKDLVKKQGIEYKFEIASSATSTEEIWNGIGNPVYPPARAELAKHGLKCDGKRAIQLQKNDYGKYDLFVGMDSANIRNMLYIFGNDPDRKIHKLMDYTSRGGDVADPWYSRNFEVTYKDVLDGCTALLDELIDKNK